MVTQGELDSELGQNWVRCLSVQCATQISEEMVKTCAHVLRL